MSASDLSGNGRGPPVCIIKGRAGADAIRALTSSGWLISMVVMLRGSLFMPGGLAACAALIGMLATGCASAPPVQRVEGYSPATGEKAAATALTMVGKPYRFRGETPSGFDCSGLVRYSYLSAGIDAPHGTMSLMKITTSVGLRNARLGDLLFFTQMGKKYSHVAIYIGNNAFVHAPSTGGSVRKDSMDDPYWQKHYLDTRRFL